MTIFTFRTAHFLTSLLWSLIPWTANPPSPSPKTELLSALNQHHFQLGLKTLIHPKESKQSPNPRIVHCCTLTRTPKRRSSPPPSLSLFELFRSFVTDNIIRTQSGNYMTSSLSNIGGFKKMVEKSEPECSHSRSRYRNATTKRIPPQLSILQAETDDLQCQTPWVFKREFTEGGRLIIRTERVQKSCEHLVPHREPLKEEEDEEEIEDMKFNEKDAEECEDEDADEEDEEAESENSLEQKRCLVDENERERCGELRKGFTYGGRSGQEPDPFWEGTGSECVMGAWAASFLCCVQRKRKETQID